MSTCFEVSLLAWSDDGQGVRVLGRTRDDDAVALVREVLRRELDGSDAVGEHTAPNLRVIRTEKEPLP